MGVKTVLQYEDGRHYQVHIKRVFQCTGVLFCCTASKSLIDHKESLEEDLEEITEEKICERKERDRKDVLVHLLLLWRTHVLVLEPT